MPSLLSIRPNISTPNADALNGTLHLSGLPADPVALDYTGASNHELLPGLNGIAAFTGLGARARVDSGSARHGCFYLWDFKTAGDFIRSS
jgi:hypothetical protein